MKPEERIPEEECRARLYSILNEIKRDIPIGPEIQYPIKDGNKSVYADLVVWDYDKDKPFLVIEIKKPKLGRGNLLNDKAYDQALNYAKLLNVPYFVLTDCTLTLIFYREGVLARPVRHYFREDMLNKELWKKIIKSLLLRLHSELPTSDNLTPDVEKNLIGVARHIAWKLLALETKSIKVDKDLLDKKSKEIYNIWMREMFGRDIIKKNLNDEKMKTEIFIIGKVSLAICGKNNTLKNIINELKKKVERNYPDFRVVDEHIVGMAEVDSIGEAKLLYNIFKGKCVVLVKGSCEDINLHIFFRLAPKHNL